MDLVTFRTFRNEPVIDPWKEYRQDILSGIERARGFLHRPQKLLIGATWVAGEAGSFTTVNPNHRDETYGPFPVSSQQQVTTALLVAQKLYRSWSAQAFEKRASIMRTLRRRFTEEKWTLIGLLMLEIGKTAVEAYAEWAEAVDFLDYYADACELIHNDAFLSVTSLPGHATRLLPKPLGIGVSLPPFNFPCAIFTGMWAAPTVVGNVLIVKPSPRAPGTGIFCAQIMHGAGAPIQIVLESAAQQNAVGRMLVEHSDVALITFTGSHRAGMAINEAAGRTSRRWIKRVVAEMGGSDFIAINDYENMTNVLDAVQASIIGFQGQKCSALSRLIIKEDLYDAVKQAVVERLSTIQLKDVVDPSSLLGGVIDAQAQETIADQCRQVVAAGGHFLIGGQMLKAYPGFGVPLSIYEGVASQSDVAGAEIFGPVFGLYKAKNFDEIVKIANSTPYALTGALFTHQPKLKARVSEFTSGNTYLNRKCTGAFVGAEPFGGWYGSGTDDKAGHWSHLLRFIHWQTISEQQ